VAHTPTPSPTPALGSISGSLMYPAEVLPALAIYAFNTSDAHQYYHVQTVAGQSTYSISGLPSGTYHVVAYSSAGDPGLAGGYTRAVPCGLSASCSDHSLIDVAVHPGEAVADIGPNDWYAPAGDFPPQPAS
jgi:hypothetical protein